MVQESLYYNAASFKCLGEDFIRVVDHMDSYVSTPIHEVKATQVNRPFAEALPNAMVPSSGVKPPRNLVKVLSDSQDFDASDTKDTFYAVIGMSNARTTWRAAGFLLARTEFDRGCVLVDHSKPLADVYKDATLYIVSRKGREAGDLVGLRHYYQRSPLHAEGLASWAVDWRSGMLEHSTQPDIRRLMRVFRDTYYSYHRDIPSRERDRALGRSYLPLLESPPPRTQPPTDGHSRRTRV